MEDHHFQGGDPIGAAGLLSQSIWRDPLINLTFSEATSTYIDKGIPPPNSPITLEDGWMRNPVSKKPAKVKGKSGTTPLVDTGQLNNVFDWEINGKLPVWLTAGFEKFLL